MFNVDWQFNNTLDRAAGSSGSDGEAPLMPNVASSAFERNSIVTVTSATNYKCIVQKKKSRENVMALVALVSWMLQPHLRSRTHSGFTA
ncbi:unnamed protein product [Arctogadus glacialis]